MEKKQLGISFFLSFLTHFLILAALIFLVYFVRKEILEFEGGAGKVAVWVDLKPIGSGVSTKSNPIQNKAVIQKNNDAIQVRQKNENKTTSTKQNIHQDQAGKGEGGSAASSEEGSGQGSGKGNGAGEGSASPSVLGLIRKKIEQAKRYPVLARTRKIEGVSVLSFAINGSGGVESLTLVKSSGSDLLDQEALATVIRATPLPYYSQPIRISIKFSLE